MRIALLSALAENPDFKGERLAFRRFVGKSVLAHQVNLALALQCETIVCLASGLSQEIIACQHLAEKNSIKFMMIDGSRRLPSIITADSEVIVLADGLLADPAVVHEALEENTRILTLPAEIGVVSGFERIDQDRAWAGAMRIRGALVDRLADLPNDTDPSSALLRIALQSGVLTAEIDPQILREGRWSLHESHSVRETREKSWLASRITPASYRAPGLAVAERIGLRLARDLLGGTLQRIPWIAATGFGIIAAALAALQQPLLGLGFVLAMAFAIALSSVFERLSDAHESKARKRSFSTLISRCADVLIASLLALSTPVDFGWPRVFIPLILIAVLLLGERIGPIGWRATFRDRIVLLTLLLPASMAGYPQEVSAILIIAVIAMLYFVSPKPDDDANETHDDSSKS